MSNEEKYKTPEERYKMFSRFCGTTRCSVCPAHISNDSHCILNWLALEAEEELLPCPFCGGTPEPRHGTSGFYRVQCDACGSSTENYDTKEEAIAAWNRRTK